MPNIVLWMRILLIAGILIVTYLAFRRRIRIVRDRHIPTIHELLQRRPEDVREVQWVAGDKRIFHCSQLSYDEDDALVIFAVIDGNSGPLEVLTLFECDGKHILSMVCRSNQIIWIDSKKMDPEKDIEDDPRLPWRLTPLEERWVYDAFLLARRHAKCVTR